MTMVKYSKEQLEVIEASASEDQIVTACPGSGKTTVIIGRIIHLVSNGLPLKDMLYLTYSKKLADEGNQKFSELTINDMHHSGTIDSLCWRLLVEKYGNDFYCEPGQIIKLILELWDKNPDWNPCPNIRKAFLDEAQDLDAPRFEVLRKICKNCTMTIVGDPRQSIYQGLFDADPRLMMLIRPDAFVKHLSICFRCSPEITSFVNSAFQYPGLPDMISARKPVGIKPIHIKMHGDAGNMRICRDEIVDMTVRRVILLKKQTKNLSDIMILSPTVRNKSLHLLNRIRTGLGRCGIASYLNKSEIDNGTRGSRSKANSVYIGTVHSSKGSEAKHVLILNCYVGSGAFHRIDHLNNLNPDYKNLLYVACTRAKDTLDIFETCHMPSRCEAIEFFENSSSFCDMKNVRVIELGPLKVSAIPSPSGVTELIQSLSIDTWSILDNMDIQKAVKHEHSLDKNYEPPRFITKNNDNDLYGLFMELVIVRVLAQAAKNADILKNLTTLPMHLSEREFSCLRFQNGGVQKINDEKFEFTATDRESLDAFIRQCHANTSASSLSYADLRDKLEDLNIVLSPSDRMFYAKLDEHRPKLYLVEHADISTADLIVEIWHTMLLKTYHQHNLALYWLKNHAVTSNDLLPRGVSNWRDYLKDLEKLCIDVCGHISQYQVECTSPARIKGFADYTTMNNNVVDIKCVACETALPSLSHRLQVAAYRNMLGDNTAAQDAYLISALSVSAYIIPADPKMDQRIVEILEEQIVVK